MRFKILIIDDDYGVRESLRQMLNRDFFVYTAVNGAEARRLIKENSFDLIILDIIMPDVNGIDLLKEIRAVLPDIPVVMITGTSEVSTASAAMQMGAFDYISKPFNPAEMLNTINRVFNLKAKEKEIVSSFLRMEDSVFFGNIVGRSQKMIEVFKRIAQVMHTSTTVLIEGDSGTGKELIARAIHFHGLRRKNPFVPVHIASLSENLLESELFGYEKGAFTGANHLKQGMLEEADSGTLFFDEVGEIPAGMQVKLLRVLQEREFRRVGGVKDIKMDVRFIAATHKDLWKMVEKGEFREDLYYRMNVIPINIPALRERTEDIPMLLEFMFGKFKEKFSSRVKGFTEDSIELLKKYGWPGNVRELENVVEHLLLVAEDYWIAPKDLPVYIQRSVDETDPLSESVIMYEKKIIEETLQKTNGVVSEAAVVLKTSRRVLKYKMDKLGITVHKNVPVG